MRSLILRVVATAILPVATLFSLHLLLRGHDHPGGGFIAGLVTAAAVTLRGLAFGADEATTALRPILRYAIVVGLAVTAASGLPALVFGEPYLTHYHGAFTLPGIGRVPVSTALVFDLGIYLIVVGICAALLDSFVRGVDA